MNFDLTNMTVDELNELAEAIKARKVELRETEKENREAERQELNDLMKAKVAEGDTVKFQYGRKNEVYTGTVVRVSDKTATVQADVFAENSKDGKDTKYVKFYRIVEVLENTAEVAV